VVVGRVVRGEGAWAAWYHLYKDKLVNAAPKIIHEGPKNKNVKARSTHRNPRRILSQLEIWNFELLV